MKKLYIPEDATSEVKEHLEAAQQGLFNVQEFKAKAEAGTLTLSDLETLSQRQLALSDVFAKGNPAAVGLTPGLNSLDDLEALAQQRMNESLSLVEQSGGPAYKVNSLEELQALADLSPEKTAEKVLAAVKQNQPPAEGAENQTENKGSAPAVKAPKRTAVETSDDHFLNQHFEAIVTLLTLSKQAFYDLEGTWPGLEPLEEKLAVHLDGLEVQGAPAIDLGLSYLTAQTEDDEAEEKKPAAAFVLSSLQVKEKDGLTALIELWKAKPETGPVIIRGLKYGTHPAINQRLSRTLPQEPVHLQAGFVEILDYRGDRNHDAWLELLNRSDPPVQSKIMTAFAHAGFHKADDRLDPLIKDLDATWYEDVMLAALIAGKPEALGQIRWKHAEKPEKTIHLPIYLALAGSYQDFPLLAKFLEKSEKKENAILALGLHGMTAGVDLLLNILQHAEWQVQRKAVQALELITGANLELPFPNIKTGPAGKEYEVTVETGWLKPWLNWWQENRPHFRPEVRYRRGTPFTLESCLTEMANPKGNYWSRQYSYTELQIRSGQHIAPFFADWNVKRQLEAIQTWQAWWQEHKQDFPDDPWLFNGKTI
jgi:uncharacterized protein (TIGR02270 family)